MLNCTVRSSCRRTCTTHGVTHFSGVSLPVTSASAPDGVEAIVICSFQPRVTDAHPPSTLTKASALAVKPNLYIVGVTPPAPRRSNHLMVRSPRGGEAKFPVSGTDWDKKSG